MVLILALLAVHRCRGSDILASYTYLFTLLHYELIEQLLKFLVLDKQVLLCF